ncbi:MAG: shikimate kinase [Clostridiaceae bacterium]|nr:shikimate kinase [Clostridiaceae bacterium]
MENYCKFDRIVLIGMPCSGKSSIGRALAEYYNYQFIDMDDMIVEKAGMSIEEIFEKLGEDKFREFEYQVSCDLRNMSKVVIATGGGVVTRPKSIEAVKEGSFVIFIHREFLRLATTPKRILDKRPMLKKTTFEGLLQLYKTRLPLYRKYADIEISNDHNRSDAIAKIIRIIHRKSVGLE